eukprot:TRINITY_DN5040_c0_g2_i2.p14 TRINITY_DN5040_c0_g2~~TRINITY_DN5040_c0_g2_i2.p14  ORF type:complete len:105 (+),score=4.66 TRINITY_DN5040_c0_g2_i2:2118-2432(+)
MHVNNRFYMFQVVSLDCVVCIAFFCVLLGFSWGCLQFLKVLNQTKKGTCANDTILTNNLVIQSIQDQLFYMYMHCFCFGGFCICVHCRFFGTVYACVANFLGAV